MEEICRSLFVESFFAIKVLVIDQTNLFSQTLCSFK